ncbi:MAG: hypothetical protein A3G23_06910 [Bacteroidetes bacterium RIFCSPLOWO2_12_FULL_37_12]|nr:MAG: hypothetical protein A3G23_06910 [Bacteroidetes bacterium RIFCSPLOWO2_12_FULL_37_12]
MKKEQTNKMLPHLQDHLAAIVQSSDDAIISKSMDGTIVYWNLGAEKIFGYKSDEVVGKSINLLALHKTDEHKEIVEKYKRGEKLEHYETKRIKKDGSTIEVSLTVSPIFDHQHKTVGFSTIARDITGKSLYSKYARSLIEASLDPLVTISADGKITDVNEASVKVTGVSREKLIGTDFSNYFTEPEKAREGYRQVFEKGFVADYPLTIKNKNGKLTDVLYNASVYKDDKGNVLGVFAAARDITKQKEVENQIQKIQTYTRMLIETSLDPQITKGTDGLIKDVNEATILVTGVPREKIIGTHFPNYFTEPQNAERAYQEAFAKGVVRNIPLAIKHTSGKITDVLYNATVYKDESGNVQGVFASARDITDRIKGEEEIKKSQAYTRSLIEASLDPLVTISADGKILDVNEASVKVTGVTREKLISTDFSNYFTEPHKAREGYQQVFEKGFVADYPLTIKHKNGNLTDVLYNASVYKDEKGNVLGVFAAARDVTEQKQTSQYARSLIEASLDPLVTISADGKILDVNEASVKVTGISREKLIGTDFSNYFTEPNKAREGYQQVFEKGFVSDYPLTIKHTSNKLTDVLYNASVYKDDKGNVLGVFAAARDITAQKQLAEREVAEREKELQRIEELERFRKLTVGRELKMVELKKEIEELNKKAN